MLAKYKILSGLCLLLLGFSFALPANGQISDAASDLPDANSYLTEFLARTLTPSIRDDYDLYSRLKSNLGPNPARTAKGRIYQQGDKETFWVLDQDRRVYYKVNATLIALTPHLYMFLDDAFKLNVSALQTAANQFENKVYPTTRRFFGDEPSPGVDGDLRLIILNTPLKGALGYFSAEDALLKTINPFSNEREMFFINNRPENLDSYLGTLAHEFQHMIEFNTLANQDTWLNEGSSVLSQQLNGFSSGGAENAFFVASNTQLNSWNCSPCGTAPNYGAGYAWLSYLNDRFGFESIHNIASNRQHLTGFNSVDYSLAAISEGALSSDSVFKQWLIANYLNRRTADPAYSYKVIGEQVKTVTSVANLPYNLPNTNINQYSARYFEVTGGDKGFTLDFKGLPQTRLVPTNPHSGKMLWWANRGDSSDTSLTREVDLSQTTKATFNFWVWYDFEPRYDYLYVEASLDGEKWEVLPGKYTVPLDTSSRAYGPALTGQSQPSGPLLGDQSQVQANWVQESIDLSKYAGKKIKLRLEYVTDEAYNRNGAVLDDFEIPEINWRDDVEASGENWQANGFARVNNLLPQKFSVQIISRDGACADANVSDLSRADNSQSCIQEVALDTSNAGRQTFLYKKALVVVAPYAPKTLVPAQFNLRIGL